MNRHVSPEGGRSLTRKEFDKVIRRAAEIASGEADAGDESVSESELLRIAGEVGLSERHVRRALRELRGGMEPGGPVDRIFGPLHIQASRVVPGTPRQLAGKLDDFFVASQLLQPVRRGPSTLQYRPAVDWASQLARAASFTSKKYYVASAKSVEARLEAVDDARTHLELVVDPGTRSDNIWGAALGGGGAGVGIGIGAAASLAAVAPIAVAAGVGIVAGGALASAITYGVGRSHKRKLLEVQAEVEGILDRLEFGESLEPPPASWRRWVKRHFHGVARDLMGADSELDDDLTDPGDDMGMGS